MDQYKKQLDALLRKDLHPDEYEDHRNLTAKSLPKAEEAI
jgi:hypothetical protein